MRPPSFWWREAGLTAALLTPFAAVYGAMAARRLRDPGAAAGIPVVCIGNFDVGGSGKTPTAMAVGRLLAAAAQRPFFLTRGYGGSLAGPVRVDPARHRAGDVGDEPLLLAALAPTVVARDRRAGAAAARESGASVIVMDDGFQNPSLRKDLAIVVLDAARGLGNGRVLPAGPLRAALAAQLARAHALLVLGEGAGADAVMTAAAARGLPVFHGRLTPDAASVKAMAGKQVLAFAGIGNPQKFFATLTEAGIDVAVKRSFPDHHRYPAADAAALRAEAKRRNLMLVTTEKDLIRIAGDTSLAPLADEAHALPVTLDLDDAEGFQRFVVERVASLA